jgi:hypothetical protein
MDGFEVTRTLGYLLSQLTMWAFVLRLGIVAHPTLHRSHGESERSGDDGQEAPVPSPTSLQSESGINLRSASSTIRFFLHHHFSIDYIHIVMNTPARISRYFFSPGSSICDSCATRLSRLRRGTRIFRRDITIIHKVSRDGIPSPIADMQAQYAKKNQTMLYACLFSIRFRVLI